MARIVETDIDLLRDKADIVEIVSGYTTLKRAGGRTLKGLCPFHAEKTPSFTVDPTRSVWHCFGCGEGGSLYQFVMKVENLPFPEAVEWVARRSGYDLHYEESRPGDAQRHSQKRRILDANREAMEFFHRALMTHSEAEPARRYLGSRGFGPEVAQRWKLGWAPGRDALCRFLMDKGFSQDDLVAADLARVSDRDGSLYDSFRRRIVFPTWSVQDDVVAFGARAMGDEQPKYLNTSETPVFSKSRFMYGLNRAKSSIARSYAIVVEGYTDVIALHEAGIEQAVATNGTALGESHFELLKKFSDRAVLMFDADEAGKGATEKGFIALKQRTLELLVAPLPVGRDPADIAQQEGAEGIRKLLDTAQPLWEFVLEREIEKAPLDTPEARAGAVRRVVGVLGWHPDPIARHEYAFKVASVIGVDPEAVQRELAARTGPRAASTGGRTESDAGRRVPGHVKVEKEALQLLLTRSEEATTWLSEIDETMFTSPARREVFNEAAGTALADSGIAERLSDEARTLYSELTVAAPDDIPPEHVREVFVRLQVFRLERDIKKRRTVLQEVNPVEEPERHDALFTELVRLEARRRDLLRGITEGAA